MLYQGKYIEFDEKKSATIQAQINQLDDLKTDLKSEVKPKDVLKDSAEWEFGKFSLFDAEKTGMQERKGRYQYYIEMDTMEFIHRALEVVSDDGTQTNDEGNSLKIFSNDEDIKGVLEDLFIKRLDTNNELWNIIYETVKMGDNFFEIVPDSYEKPKKIVFLKYLKPEKVDRIEKNGRLSHYEYTTEEDRDNQTLIDTTKTNQKQTEIIYKLQPWQIIHFKITDREHEPYGGSLLKSGVKTYRRLALLEDVMLVYRISRAPERRVFYIDVGNMNYTDAKRFIQKIKGQYRTQNFVDEDGNLNKRANILSITSDIFVPTKEGGQGTKIETLQGGEALNKIDDLNYFKDKILRTMNIPSAYLGSEADRSRGSLSQLDIKFGRFIERIQAQILKGLNKIAALELFFSGKKKEDLANFSIEMTPPSNIKEITEIDLINQRMGLIGAMQGLNLFSNEYMLKNILKLSDKEVADIILQRNMEAQQQQQGGVEAGMTGAPGVGGAMGAIGAGGPEAGIGGPETGGPESGIGGAGSPTTGGPAGIAADTIIKALGKEFLVENKDDFFKMMKYLKEDVRNDKIPLFETISEMIRTPVRRSRKDPAPKTNNIPRLFIINEFGGINFGNGSKQRSMRLFDHNDNYTEKEILLED